MDEIMAVVKLKFSPVGMEKVVEITAKDWTEPPPFKKYYTSEQQSMYLIQLFTTKGLEAVLEKIPVDTGLGRVNVTQFERARGGKATLVLGKCTLKCAHINVDDASCPTKRVVSTLELPSGSEVLHLDMRTQCHRMSDEPYCKRVDGVEARVGCSAMALQNLIAQQCYDIEIMSMVSYSGCWRRPAGHTMLAKLLPDLSTLPCYYALRHFGHMGTASRYLSHEGNREAMTNTFWKLRAVKGKDPSRSL
ncbi:hypothetical protein LTR10_011980 [Elasticomyces elasticus]|nr:hypothetical protein LTR10_011980 [Elasticomyces elasticus]KAK4968922.1 hypothetical protein LTR42_009201 [Elasticomyces elasticus]